MRTAGLTVAPSPAELGSTVAAALAKALLAEEGRREVTRRPTVVVTRRLPGPVEEELSRDFEARLNRDDRPLGPTGLQDALRTADALLCTVTDRLTADVLGGRAAPGPAAGQLRSRLQPHRYRGRQGPWPGGLEHPRRADRSHRRHRDDLAADGQPPRRGRGAPCSRRCVDRLAAHPYAGNSGERKGRSAWSAWAGSPGPSPGGRTAASACG